MSKKCLTSWYISSVKKMERTKKHKTLKINQLEKMALIINELCIVEKNIRYNVWNYGKRFVILYI